MSAKGYGSAHADQVRAREADHYAREPWGLSPEMYHVARHLDATDKALLRTCAAIGKLELGREGAPALERLAQHGFLEIDGSIATITIVGLRILAMTGHVGYGR